MRASISFLIIVFSFACSSVDAQTSTAPSAGDGSGGSPYQIATWQNLYWISQNPGEWGKQYIQTADIDLGTATPAIDTWNSGAGWTPIGNASVKFSGTYNGQGHTVKGLFIDRPASDNIGFFGYTYAASISNLGIGQGSISGQHHVGGLVGANYGATTISNCSNSSSVRGASQIGGLVGNNNDGTISKCYNSGTIGNGIVTTSGAYYVGGLVGHNNVGSINNSHSSGTINGGYWGVGGLVGYNNTDGGTVDKCYSTGQVIAYPDPAGGLYRYGGLIGDCCSGPVSNSYWDTQTSGTSMSPSGKGTGRTTSQMKTQSTFSGWDFVSTWEIVGGDGANYPRLQGNPDPVLPVDGITLTARVVGNAVTLLWRTEMELNNVGFEIQRAMLHHQHSGANGTAWCTVGFVNGSGTSNAPLEYSFMERSLTAGRYIYRLKQIDHDGTSTFMPSVEVIIDDLSTSFLLEQNFPNPFNPSTTVRFSVPTQSRVRVTVCDMLGRNVAELFNGTAEPGTHQVIWNTDAAAGIYLCRVEGSSLNNTGFHFSRVRTMQLLK